MNVTTNGRRSTQALLPERHPGRGDTYDLYPAFPLAQGAISSGWDAVAANADGAALLLIDGGAGVDWPAVTSAVEQALRSRGRTPLMRSTASVFPTVEDVDRWLAPALGGDDPVFGRRLQGSLGDLVDHGALRALAAQSQDTLVVVVGPAAALADETAPLVYLEVPRNEQQYRARAGTLVHLGAQRPASDAKQAYKRLYFAEWPLLEEHKAAIWTRIDRFVDVQRAVPFSLAGIDLRETLSRMARSPFRARPWFEPGAWGGQWLARQVPDLPQDVPNYAWSFELISPENGVLIEDPDGHLVETGFDSLMMHAAGDVLGTGTERFGRSFPIRFDYLDTIEGGNLSIQCHPRTSYMLEHFGEPYTQDETYYMVAADDEATVYLGLRDGVSVDAFGRALRASADDATPLDIERFVQTFPARTGDFFLIPSGTVHASGRGGVVLEISATPYIFTFKMYDWLRLDLDGQPRPLNIERGLTNLVPERAGQRVRDELISRPRPDGGGSGWRREHLPTHHEHFYDVHRYVIESSVEIDTGASPHVLTVVAGHGARIGSDTGPEQRVRFAETYVVPAAARRYRLVAEAGPVTVVVAFLKDGGESA